jgi:cell division protein FtsL
MKKQQIRRQVNFNRLAVLILGVSFGLFILSRIALNAINVSLSITHQKNVDYIEQLKREQETLQLDVQKLSTYDRIALIAASDGMRLNQNNVVFVTKDN